MGERKKEEFFRKMQKRKNFNVVKCQNIFCNFKPGYYCPKATVKILICEGSNGIATKKVFKHLQCLLPAIKFYRASFLQGHVW